MNDYFSRFRPFQLAVPAIGDGSDGPVGHQLITKCLKSQPDPLFHFGCIKMVSKWHSTVMGFILFPKRGSRCVRALM